MRFHNQSTLAQLYAARDEWAQLTITAQRAGAYDLVCKYNPRQNASTKEIQQAIAALSVALAVRKPIDQPIQSYTLPTD